MIKNTENGILVGLKIIPNSSKNEIVVTEDIIKIKITALPIENKANKALVEFLSKQFKLAKSNIEIVKGENSKDKTIFFKTDDSKKKEFIISQLTSY